MAGTNAIEVVTQETEVAVLKHELSQRQQADEVTVVVREVEKRLQAISVETKSKLDAVIADLTKLTNQFTQTTASESSAEGKKLSKKYTKLEKALKEAGFHNASVCAELEGINTRKRVYEYFLRIRTKYNSVTAERSNEDNTKCTEISAPFSKAMRELADKIDVLQQQKSELLALHMSVGKKLANISEIERDAKSTILKKQMSETKRMDLEHQVAAYTKDLKLSLLK